MERFTDNPPEKVMERLRKIARLAESGYNGEADTAKRKLEAELLRYGITLDDLLSSDIHEREFKVANIDQVKVFIQVLAMHFGQKSDVVKGASVTKRAPYRFWIKLKDADWIDFSQEVDYYLATWKREKKRADDEFRYAFYSRFGLFPSDVDEDKKRDPAELSFEELKRLVALRDGIKSPSYHRMIEQ